MMHAIRTCTYLIAITFLFSLSSLAQKGLLDSVINEKLLRSYVSRLAADSMKGRLTGSPEALKAAEIIRAEFKAARTVPLQRFPDYFMWHQVLPSTGLPKDSIGFTKAFHVLASLPGKSKPAEIIIFSAHYDHVGTTGTIPYEPIVNRETEPGDTIYNGANDNASGVAALLALAKYYGKLKNNERTILFIAFSAEELGTIGSNEYIKTINNPAEIKAMINLEMLGRTETGKFGQPYITGYDLSDLRELLNKELETRNSKKYGQEYFGKDTYVRENLFERSDNYPFALIGIPAHTIMAGSPVDPKYHSVEDETYSLNFSMMAEIVKAIATAAAPLINGSLTPRRIDPARLSTH